MRKDARAERTARILSARIEELASALERSAAPAGSLSRLLESASMATTNAVALDLLSAEAAEAIWRDVEERHPRVAPLRHAA